MIITSVKHKQYYKWKTIIGKFSQKPQNGTDQNLITTSFWEEFQLDDVLHSYLNTTSKTKFQHSICWISGLLSNANCEAELSMCV
jgi:hypothetical protein